MRRFALLAIAILALSPAVVSAAAPAAPGLPAGADEEWSGGGRTCGTPSPQRSDMEQVERVLGRLAAEQPLPGLAQTGTIRVAFHVIESKHSGQVTDDQIAEQIAELNRAYAGTGYQFELVQVDRTEQPGWYHMAPGNGAERHAKETLAVDPAHTLNIYTCAPGRRLLGWAYLPWSAPEDHYIHGVVVHYGSMPGGYLTPYNLGRTVVHEVGHYLGLLHTFENGCDAPGDYVDDTAFEAEPAYGCPEGRNTCPDPDPDPIHNYMDYGDDPCITEFTAGQGARMDQIVPAYRPSLLAKAIARVPAGAEIGSDATNPADLSSGIEFRGAGPNPFRLQTAVRFTLPHPDRVTLEVFNVAGQRVRSLIDAQLPAGVHAAMFSGKGLAAGLYFLQLRVGEARMTRSVILLR